MFCNKCGAENIDGSSFCSKCGAQLTVVEGNNDITLDALQNLSETQRKKDKADKRKTKLHTGFLLNIFSSAVLILLFILLEILSGQPGKDSLISVSISSKAPTSFNTIVFVLFFVNFVSGFVIYYIKKQSFKKILPYVYLLLSIVLCCMMIMGNTTDFLCGGAWIFIVPFVMQIVAGAKFISGLKHYED